MASTALAGDPEVGSMFKVGQHRERVGDSLAGRNVFPVTLELDLTGVCTRACPECPGVNSARHRSLSVEFLWICFHPLCLKRGAGSPGPAA